MADVSLSKKRLVGWLALLAAIGKVLGDLFGNNREVFKCSCIRVEEVIKRHSKQVPDSCKVSDALPTNK
jgi:hypothetical protein